MLTKCIAVHLADDPRHLPRLRLAVDLAKRFGAHLNVVYAKEQVHAPAGAVGRAASLAYIEDAAEVEHEHVAAIKQEVDEACAALPSWEWHEEHGAVDRQVARWAHLSDLVIAEQAPHDHVEDSVMFHMTDNLVMSAGCPMLLVPTGWEEGTVGKRTLIAWNNSREAIGAVRGALSFLSEAEKVWVLILDDDGDTDPSDHNILSYLGHHGIQAELAETNEKGGKGILNTAEKIGCDLLVMGAYHHSRLRALFVGGPTDYVMRHAKILVLMRH